MPGLYTPTRRIWPGGVFCCISIPFFFTGSYAAFRVFKGRWSSPPMSLRPGLSPPDVRVLYAQLKSGLCILVIANGTQNRWFLCSFLVTAGLQGQMGAFEPRGGPGMGKDRKLASQMGSNTHPLWYRAPMVLLCSNCHVIPMVLS